MRFYVFVSCVVAMLLSWLSLVLLAMSAVGNIGLVPVILLMLVNMFSTIYWVRLMTTERIKETHDCIKKNSSP